MKQLVFATNNKHKLDEVAAKLAGKFTLLSLADIGCLEDIAETGHTFAENALIKSRYVFDNYQLDCFSDDSGLEVDALNGEPGIYSARYAGEHGNHDANIDFLLQNLKNKTNRTARFKTVVSLVVGGEEYFFEGLIEGHIRKERCGTDGFGYDPIFEPAGFNITFAEMSLEQKNKISHRGIAVEKLINFLNLK